MFTDAIENTSRFTRPVHTIHRYFGSTAVLPAAATLFFVNADGWALTCGHVAKQLAAAADVNSRYESFKKDLAQLPTKNRRQLEKNLERKYKYDKKTVVELKHRFVDCIEGPLNLDVKLHPELDVALLHFRGFKALGVREFPMFAAMPDNLRPGQSLCRLGFPFPEFTNFSFDSTAQCIVWTNEGRGQTPRFPMDGMVTRRLLSSAGDVIGFELSTPGLRGQSGGPAFDLEGRVWGMQCATAHLDLDFDVDIEVVRNGQQTRIKESAILHVGHCVHAKALKEFMQQNGVAFLEG